MCAEIEAMIDVVVDDVERHLADRLHRVGVEQHAALVAQRADLADRLQHANLVVGGHDGDQNGLVVHGALQVVEIEMRPSFCTGR